MLVRPLRPGDEADWRRLRHALWPETTEVDHTADLTEYLGAPDTQVILVAETAPGGAGAGCREFASDTRLENRISRAAHRALGFEESEPLISFRKSLDPDEDLP